MLTQFCKYSLFLNGCRLPSVAPFRTPAGKRYRSAYLGPHALMTSYRLLPACILPCSSRAEEMVEETFKRLLTRSKCVPNLF